MAARNWDRDAELAAIPDYPREGDRVIAAMWVWLTDLRYAGTDYATAKTDHERVLGKSVVAQRATGEKSGEVAEHRAISQDDEVYRQRISYRLAEQRVTQCKEALRILHARLDDLRTQAADARAADSFQSRRDET